MNEEEVKTSKQTLDLDLSLLEEGFEASSTINPKTIVDFETLPPFEDAPFFTEDTEEQIFSSILRGDKIGEGGMGVVYSGQQFFPRREVAIKKLRDNQDFFTSSLLDEAMVIGELSHPNIPPIYQLNLDENGCPEIIMKKVEGRSLEDILGGAAQKDLALRDALQILIQVCHAVELAHSHGFLHRDLKPENIMVGQFNQVYLMDWGITVNMNIPEKSLKGLAGTPAYMAPEMLLGDPTILTETTDVYLLGTILHEILTGTPRNQGSSLEEVLKSAEKCSIYNYPSSIPKILGDICNEACAKEVSERIQSAEDFRKKLEEFLEHWEAIKLVEKGMSQLARYRKLWQQEKQEDEINHQLLNQLSLQTKFSFEQAIEIWSKATAAKKGLFDTMELMIDQYLHQKEFHQAILLFEEYPELFEERPRLVARFEEATTFWTEEQTRQIQLNQMEKELDPSLTAASRALVQKTLFGGVMVATIILAIWSFVAGVFLSTEHLLYSMVLVCIPIWIVTAFHLRSLTVNEFGRQAIRVLLSGTAASLLSRYVGWYFKFDIPFIVALDCLILSLTMFNSAPAVRNGPRLGILALLTLVVSLSFPDYSVVFLNTLLAVAAVVVAYEWWDADSLAK